MSDANIMYIIIDTTTGKAWKYYGIYPFNLIGRIVNKGHTPLVISTYANTIKYHNKTTVKDGIAEVLDRDEALYYSNLYLGED